MIFRRLLTAIVLSVFLSACGSTHPAEAATKAQSIQFLLSQVRASGVALAGGKVYFYQAGTTPVDANKKTVWLDRGKSNVASNPYTLDSNATASLFGDGLYRVVIKDSAGITRFDRDNLAYNDLQGLSDLYTDSGAWLDATFYATLAEADAAAVTAGKQLVISTEWTVTPSTLNSNIKMLPGGKIDNPSALTIAGEFEGAPDCFVVGRSVTFGKRISPDPRWWGAKGDGTECAGAIQSAINSITNGKVSLSRGRFGIGTTLAVSKPGITVEGAAPAGQGAVNSNAVTELFAAGSNTVVIRYGDPTESSADGAHIDNGGMIKNLAITGSVSTTSGVRIYNSAVRVEDVYISNVVASGGVGLYAKKAWKSSFSRVISQSNASKDIHLSDSANNVLLTDVACLSSNTTDGLYIDGGSNTITLINFDAEGKKHGIVLDTTLGSLQNLALIGGNFESNATLGIKQMGTLAIDGLTMINTRHNASGDGVYLAAGSVKSGNISGMQLTDSSLVLSSNLAYSDVLINNIILNGSAAIVGNYRKTKAVENLYEEVSTAGAVAYTLDAGIYLTSQLVLSGAATAATYTIDNVAKRAEGETITLAVGNGGTATAGGAITLPAAFKTTAAFVIPSANKRTSITFVKDSTGSWWEVSRATNAG